MQILHWVDLKDPVVRTWPPSGFAVIRVIRTDHLAYFTSTVVYVFNASVISNKFGPYEEIHVALIDDGTHYRDTEYYQRQDQEGLDIPSSYWLGTPALHEKRVSKKNRANPAGGATRGQTKSGRRKSKTGLDR